MSFCSAVRRSAGVTRWSGGVPKSSKNFAVASGVNYPFATSSLIQPVIVAASVGLRPLLLCGSTTGVTGGAVTVGAVGAGVLGAAVGVSFMVVIPSLVMWGLFNHGSSCVRPQGVSGHGGR